MGSDVVLLLTDIVVEAQDEVAGMVNECSSSLHDALDALDHARLLVPAISQEQSLLLHLLCPA